MADDDDLPPAIEEDSDHGINVVMPSDLNTAARAPGGLVIRQLTEEERQRYPVERPTKQDLLVARAAGLTMVDIAREYGKPYSYIVNMAKLCGVGIKPGRTDPERATLRKKIEEEMATKEVVAPREETRVVSRRSRFEDKLTKEFLEIEIQRHNAGEIGKIVGCSDNTVGKYLKQYGIPNPWLTKKPPATPPEAPKAESVADESKSAPPMLSVADLAANARAVKHQSVLAEAKAKLKAEAEMAAKPESPPPSAVIGVDPAAGKDSTVALAFALQARQRPAKFHKLIDGMLDELPPLSEGWTTEGAAQWISLMNRVLVQVYRLGSDAKPAA